MKLLFVFLSLVLMVGCGATSTVAPSGNVIPVWALTTPPDTTSYMYGVGQAKSLAAAKNAALAEIVSKINVVISNQTTTSDSLVDGSSRYAYHSTIKLSFDHVALNSYEIEESAISGNSFFTLVRFNRQSFILNRKSELNVIDIQLSSLMSNYDQKSALIRYRLHAEVESKIDAARTILVVLNGLSASDLVSYELRYIDWLNMLAKTKNSLSFNLNYDIDGRFVANGIEYILAKQDIQVNTKSSNRIDVNIVTVKEVINDNGAINTHLVVELIFTDSDGVSFSSSLRGSGRSYEGALASLRQASEVILLSLRKLGAVL